MAVTTIYRGGGGGGDGAPEGGIQVSRITVTLSIFNFST
jgi:hypothetical protein